MHHMIETLETRRMLHVSAVRDGVLFVVGGEVNTVISIFSGKRTFTLRSIDGGIAGEDEVYNYSSVNSVNIQFGSKNDVLNVGSLRLPMVIRGGGGNDFLSGGTDRDYIRGDGGRDTIQGNGGPDRMDGGSAGDLLVGGPGRDIADYSKRTERLEVTIGDTPNDGEIGEGDNVRWDVEAVWGGSGNDSLQQTANRAAALYGYGGSDTLVGGGLNDSLYGGEGPDQLLGNDGNDLIVSNDDGASPIIDEANGGNGTDTAESDGIDLKLLIP
jgi:Ca2+-binding RTX toxin-like protein